MQAHQNKERETFMEEKAKLGGAIIKKNIFERNWEFKV